MITRKLALGLFTKPQRLFRFHRFTFTHLVSILWSHATSLTMRSLLSCSSCSPIDNPLLIFYAPVTLISIWVPAHHTVHRLRIPTSLSLCLTLLCLTLCPTNVLDRKLPPWFVQPPHAPHSRFPSPPCNCLSKVSSLWESARVGGWGFVVSSQEFLCLIPHLRPTGSINLLAWGMNKYKLDLKSYSLRILKYFLKENLLHLKKLSTEG